MVTYPYSHGVDRKAPRGTYVVRRLATLELDHGTAKRRQLSTTPAAREYAVDRPSRLEEGPKTVIPPTYKSHA